MGKGYTYMVCYEDSPEIEIEYMLVTKSGIVKTNWMVPGTLDVSE